MLKESVSVQDVCDLLNEMLKADYGCVEALVSYRAMCSDIIADHPTIQVRKFKDDEFPTVGILGILNGLFGIREDGMGALCMEVDDEDGTILGFKPTPLSSE